MIGKWKGLGRIIYTQGKQNSGFVSFTCTMRICQDPTQLGEDFCYKYIKNEK